MTEYRKGLKERKNILKKEVKRKKEKKEKGVEIPEVGKIRKKK